MRIQGPHPLSPKAGVKKKSSSSSGASFADSLSGSSDGDETGGAAPVLAAANVGLPLLLSLQEQGQSNDEQAWQQGHSLLDQLDQLRFSLLAGRMAATQLHRLQQTLKSQPTPDTPALKAALDDIELRVRVEIAKYQQR